MAQTHIGLCNVFENGAKTHQEDMIKVLAHALSMSLHPTPEDALSELSRSEIVCLMAITSLGMFNATVSNSMFKAVEDWKLFPRVTSYFGGKMKKEYDIPKPFLIKAYKFALYGKKLGFLEVPSALLRYIKVLINEMNDECVVSRATGSSACGPDSPGRTAQKEKLTSPSVDGDNKDKPRKSQVSEDGKRATENLWDAVKSSNLQAVESTVEAGADLGSRNELGDTPLHVAARNSNDTMVRTLLTHGAEVERKGQWEYTPLHYAARSGSIGCVTALLDAGSDPRARDQYGDSPLHEAASDGRRAVLESLLAHGADLEGKGQSGRTPLHCAAMSGSESCVSVLLNAGAGLNVRDTYLWTPLHRASGKGHLPCTKLLVERGADLNAKTIDGYTPLHEAADSGHLPCTRFLVERGADLNARDNIGRAPLHLVADNNNLSCTMLLVEKGADRNARASDGRTPLALAWRHPTIQEYLRGNGGTI